MTIQNTSISNFVAEQFPKFYKDEGPKFIMFMEAYYEYLEQESGPLGLARNLLSIRDVDSTLGEFMSHFSAKYLYGIPEKVKFDKPFLIKHILDVYRSKGTTRGYKLLFKMLYDEDIDIYLPSRDIFATSDGEWYEPQFLEVTNNPNNDSLVSRVVRGTSSHAEAVVDTYIRQPVKNRNMHIFYLTNITGKFVRGEKLTLQEDSATPMRIQNATTIIGSFTDVIMAQGGQKFVVGDTLVALTGSGIEAEALVTQVANGTGTLALSILNSGSMYTTDATDIITRVLLDANNNPIPRATSNVQPSGRGASFDVGSIVNVSQQTFCDDLIMDYIDNVFHTGVANVVVTANGAGYSNTIANTITSTPLIFTNRFYLERVKVVARGSNYSNGDTIRVVGGTSNAVLTVQTTDSGAILDVDIINPGLWQTNTAATLIITSQNGGGANLVPSLANTGSGATGYIVTNNSNNVVQARISTPGVGYVVPPIVTVGNTSGTGATFAANVNTDFAFRPTLRTHEYTSIEQTLSHTTKNFGAIGSLTNIATGNNYASEPKVVVRDFIYSRNMQGNVYFANTGVEVRGIGTNFTRYFKPGDCIRLEIVDDLPDVRYDHRIVMNVVNTTFLTVDDNPRYSANGNIDQIYILNGGTLYKNTDTITVTGGGGTGFTANVVTDNAGVIVKATIRTIGGGYTARPTLTVTSATGKSANLYATITDSDYYFASNTVSANWYNLDLPTNIFTPGSTNKPGEDSKIQGLPVFGTGIIKTVRLKNSGFGYVDGEAITFATFGALDGIVIETPGSGYANGDNLVISGGSAQTPATAVVSTDNNGVINFVSITYPGSGYKYVPDIDIISAKGKGATFSTKIGGLNTKYNVSGSVVLTGIGKLKGKWESSKSFLSSDKYLQDSFYYQDYSYEIRSSIPFDDYSDLIKKIYHMAGTELFGRMIKTDSTRGVTKVPYETVVHAG